MIRGVQHHGFTVSDMDKSLAFYRDTLGIPVEWDIIADGEGVSDIVGVPNAEIRIALLRLGEKDLMELLEYRGAKRQTHDIRNFDPGSSHISILVDNIHVMYADLQKKGVQFTCPPVCHTEGELRGWICTYFKDPDGYTIELHQVTPRV